MPPPKNTGRFIRDWGERKKPGERQKPGENGGDQDSGGFGSIFATG